MDDKFSENSIINALCLIQKGWSSNPLEKELYDKAWHTVTMQAKKIQLLTELEILNKKEQENGKN